MNAKATKNLTVAVDPLIHECLKGIAAEGDESLQEHVAGLVKTHVAEYFEGIERRQNPKTRELSGTIVAAFNRFSKHSNKVFFRRNIWPWTADQIPKDFAAAVRNAKRRGRRRALKI